jgi:hypothetical protein
MWRGMSVVNFPSWWREVNKDGVHSCTSQGRRFLGVHCARNKTGYLRISYHWSAFAKPLLLWKNKEYNNMFRVWVFSVGYAKRMRHTVIRGLSSCTIFLYTTWYTARLAGEKKLYWTWNVCSDFLYNFYLKHYSFEYEFSEIRWMYSRSSCKVPIIHVRFEWNLNILDRFS